MMNNRIVMIPHPDIPEVSRDKYEWTRSQLERSQKARVELVEQLKQAQTQNVALVAKAADLAKKVKNLEGQLASSNYEVRRLELDLIRARYSVAEAKLRHCIDMGDRQGAEVWTRETIALAAAFEERARRC